MSACPVCDDLVIVAAAPIEDGGADWASQRFLECPVCFVKALTFEESA